jgi:hypothetical protein
MSRTAQFFGRSSALAALRVRDKNTYTTLARTETLCAGMHGLEDAYAGALLT